VKNRKPEHRKAKKAARQAPAGEGPEVARSSQLRVVAGSAHLNVEVKGQAFVVDAWNEAILSRSRTRTWRWRVTRDAWGSEEVGGGKAKTWAEAYRRSLRCCAKVAVG
jgi:hypothetical protein